MPGDEMPVPLSRIIYKAVKCLFWRYWGQWEVSTGTLHLLVSWGQGQGEWSDLIRAG